MKGNSYSVSHWNRKRMDAMSLFWSIMVSMEWCPSMSIPPLCVKPFIERWRSGKRRFLELLGSIRRKDISIFQRNRSTLMIRRRDRKNIIMPHSFTLYLSILQSYVRFPFLCSIKNTYGLCISHKNMVILWTSSSRFWYMKRGLTKSVSKRRMSRNVCLMRLSVVSRDQSLRLWLTSAFLAGLSRGSQRSRELCMLVLLLPRKKGLMLKFSSLELLNTLAKSQLRLFNLAARLFWLL